MKITQPILNYLHSHISSFPPETGGVLGSSDGTMINMAIMDRPTANQYTCYYSPNVSFLNECINNWQVQDIHFMGLFHTHFEGVETLSTADKHYISNIMKAMPSTITSLFFPIYVLPQRELISYRATITNEKIEIHRENIEIL